jgi:hypothetical protein
MSRTLSRGFTYSMPATRIVPSAVAVRRHFRSIKVGLDVHGVEKQGLVFKGKLDI